MVLHCKGEKPLRKLFFEKTRALIEIYVFLNRRVSKSERGDPNMLKASRIMLGERNGFGENRAKKSRRNEIEERNCSRKP